MAVLVGIWGSGAIRQRAISQRPGRVHKSSQVIDDLARVALLIDVVEELGRRLTDLNFQGSVLVLRNHEHGKGGDPALVLSGVSSPKTVVDDLVCRYTDRLCNSFPKEREDLVATLA